jgi:hypothetical protein
VFWDGIARENRARVAAMPGHTMVRLDPAERAKANALMAKVNDAWVASTPGGEAVMSAFRAEYAALAKPN